MDFFAAAKDAMNAASEQASQRVAQAQAGKRLLDDGGPEMEQKIATKAHCRRTTNADTMAVATISDIAAQYEEAMQELTRALASWENRRAAPTPPPPSPPPAPPEQPEKA